MSNIDQLRQEVVRCEVELSRAQKDLAAAQHAEDVAAWKNVRDGLRVAAEQFESLKAKLTAAADKVIAVNDVMVAARDALENHRAKRPLDFDDAVPEWSEQDAKLQAAFDRERHKYSDAVTVRDRLQLEAVKVGKHVDQLMYSERNARAKASGTHPASGWQGSVTRV